MKIKHLKNLRETENLLHKFEKEFQTYSIKYKVCCFALTSVLFLELEENTVPGKVATLTVGYIVDSKIPIQIVDSVAT